MNFFVILGIAIGLAMDSLAVAIAIGVNLQKVHPGQIFRLSFHFAIFHVLMLILGWYAGYNIEKLISEWDHWIAFLLLAFVGGKAIYSSFQNDEDRKRCNNDPTKGMSLIMLSIATSIDAFAVGMSFAFMQVRIWFPVMVIGIVIATLTTIGLLLGNRLGAKFGRRMEIFGGVVLIAIGIKILLEHLF